MGPVTPGREQFPFLTRFAIYFLTAATVIVGALAYAQYQEFCYGRRKAQAQETLRLTVAARTMEQDLTRVIATTRTLADSDILADYISSSSPAHRQRLERMFLTLAEHERIYDQVRYLDRSGRERVRINFTDGRPYAVAEGALQEKIQRYYFNETLRRERGEIYVSPLDLNIERGDIEIPHKPMIRVGMPVFGADGERAGIIVLNYLAGLMLEHYREVMVNSWGQPMLLNDGGFWLVAPEQADEWGFMFANGNSFAARYPAAWRHISGSESGTVSTPEGHFSFTTVRPETPPGSGTTLFAPTEGAVGGEYWWKAVTRVAPAQFAFAPGRQLAANGCAVGLLLLMVAGLTLPLARLRSRNLREAAALRISEERLKAVLDNTTSLVMLKDREGRYLLANRRFKSVFGLSEAALAGASDESFFIPEDVEVLRRNDRAVLRSGRAMELEETLHHPEGERTYLSVKIPLHDSTGQTYAVCTVATDITERKRTERALRQAAAVFDNTSEGIIIADAECRMVAVNEALTRISGFARKELLGQNPRMLRSHQHPESFYQSIYTALAQSGQWQGEIWNRRKDGEIYPAWENISAVRDEHGLLTNYVAILADISAVKQTEARLVHLAHHDALTGLPNRLLFGLRLEHALERGKRHGTKVALLFLDLDRFKRINDTLGHAAGDRLLQSVATRLKECVREEDTVARQGGDEFTIILDEIGHDEDAALMAEKIIEAIARPYLIDGQEVVTSTSIGISIFPADAAEPAHLAKAADTAMYRAKERGRNTYRFYTAEMTAKAQQHLTLEQGLRRALERNEFVLHYQPQYALQSRRVAGVEALIRWQHPERGLLLPGAFMEVAEETGLIGPIGEWVLTAAVAQASAWRSAGVDPVRMAVNFSGKQFLRDHVADHVERVLAAPGTWGAGLTLEIELTETELQTAERSLGQLEKLKSLGVMLAVDDFGTGYSSFGRLKQLPVDRLKIDRSFVKNIPSGGNDEAIAAAIIAMGHNLDLHVVAEGVETAEQLGFLEVHHCDEVQGYYLSRPLPADAVQVLLAA